ncbi:MAG: TraC family protein [Proteobacteria bacterium]|nr:TraC family protein [Pseudomonadota bacterium]
MGMTMDILRTLFTSNGLSRRDLKRMLRRVTFSSYLPYRAFDPDSHTYVNMDDSLGWIWECQPLVFAGTQTFTDLQGLFTAGLPDDTVLQFILYADPDVTDITGHYASLKTRDEDIVRETTRRTVEYIQEGTRGLKQMAGIPVRKARLFVVLKLAVNKNQTEREVLSFRDNIFEILKGANLAPTYAHPGRLIQLIGGIINGKKSPQTPHDPMVPINKQIIQSETRVQTQWDRIFSGDRIFRCHTVKKMATTIEPLTFNFLTGDIWGPRSDGNQITVPYILAVNIVFCDLYTSLHAKTNLVIKQQAAGSIAHSLQRKQAEYLWASGELDKGVRFIRIQPIIWHMAKTETESRETSARVKRLWDAKGFVTQEDRGILNILFLSALPFGLYTQEGAVDFIDRDFICHPGMAVKCLPIQHDFMGGGKPHMLFTGRKGQIVAFDLFSKTSNNYNGLISAESGSGKSFVTNKIAYEMFASGAKIRLIDIGGSYRKLCSILNGKFINFSKRSRICLNPFSNITDIDEDIASIAAVISQMIFSKSQKAPEQSEYTIIKAAIRSVYEIYGTKGDIDKVCETLRSPKKHMAMFYEMEESCEEDNCLVDLKKLSTEMAFNLRTFTREGEYGKWFNGPATLNIATDEFVVLELDELKVQPELFNVVTLQLINEITTAAYLSDKSQKQVIIFDEAWQFFGESSLLAQVIEEGYRKARKSGVSFFCITQSVMDTQQFGKVGAVIRANSANKLMLQSSDIQQASAQKIIDYPPFVIELLKSVKSPKPRYSEIFIDCPSGCGVMRLSVDPFTYLMYTSDADDNRKINTLLEQGLSYTQVFNRLAGDEETA